MWNRLGQRQVTPVGTAVGRALQVGVAAVGRGRVQHPQLAPAGCVQAQGDGQPDDSGTDDHYLAGIDPMMTPTVFATVSRRFGDAPGRRGGRRCGGRRCGVPVCVLVVGQAGEQISNLAGGHHGENRLVKIFGAAGHAHRG